MRGWGVGSMGKRQLCTYMYDVKSSSGVVVVGVCGTWCAAYIHTEYTANNHLNDSQYIFPNAIFDTILATHLQQ